MIHAFTHKDNESSRRMLEKNGFTRNIASEAAHAEMEEIKEEMQHLVIYTLHKA